MFCLKTGGGTGGGFGKYAGEVPVGRGGAQRGFVMRKNTGLCEKHAFLSRITGKDVPHVVLVLFIRE